MSATLHASSSFKIPNVTQAEIDWFHEAHFSNAAVELFHTEFLQPQDPSNNNQGLDGQDEWYEEEDDDGLGYYSDGVKRTLTDEQIAIFRHSELEALRRVEAKVAKNKAESATLLQEAADLDNNDAATAQARANNSDKAEELQDGSEDGEIETEKPVLTKSEINRRKRQRAKQRKKQQQKFHPEKKPDLRKRTWDVVDTGMDSLDYDDSEMAPGDAGTSQAAKRRQISYDD
ncbi:hypothetical protein F5X96DRAFT_667439 [Biscogniauxia mediterranea]|nr:hypothetical protein F5X96DRAFT_667439 [Biscogniauxia mediterranea]